MAVYREVCGSGRYRVLVRQASVAGWLESGTVIEGKDYPAPYVAATPTAE